MPKAAERAEAFVTGGPGTVAEVSAWAEELREAGEYSRIAPLLIAAARRALYKGWEGNQRERLAETMGSHQRYGYARRLLGRVRREEGDSEERRQEHAFCTYKDLELPAARRLDRALEILREGGSLRDSQSAKTLGRAGEIFKRRWEVDVKRADLESSRWCYERGYSLRDDSWHQYAGVNAAFVCDRLAALEDEGIEPSEEASRLRARAQEIRGEIVTAPPQGQWADATVGEALFGLGRFDEAEEHLRRARSRVDDAWQLEATAMQLAELGRLQGVGSERMATTLKALLGDPGGALERSDGKVGLALSGGGFRASLFHVGVLARLAECGVLRRVEVLSCVSGGSILGAFYYLKLRRLLQDKTDAEIADVDYVHLVHEVATQFLDGVREDLRGHLFTGARDDLRMVATDYSRTERAADLLDQIFYSKVPKEPRGTAGAWRLTELLVAPAGTAGEGFSLRYDNWRRRAKVPMLVLNATTLNTGHSWQFTASWMGEPPDQGKERVDAMRRLRRVYYGDAPEHHQNPRLAVAVAASAAVPTLFPPVKLAGLYREGDDDERCIDDEKRADDERCIDVELSDGGVHDNQGVASLLEQDCTVTLVSDASGQAPEDEYPARGILGVAGRANSVLMARVRGAQYEDLAYRRRAGILRGLMIVHLKKGLPAPPRDWSGCQEPYELEEDALSPAEAADGGPYGIDQDAQRALAELRTDLDRFSDDEAYALMAAGYRMASVELAQALPELAVPDPALERAVSWPFAATLDRLAEPGDLTDELRVGHERFFRRFRTWWGQKFG
ncbi:MAG TPA: patatin-like phospholipase family protein [Solirubrobacterales bacterium]|jgi:predicted acylesterase/phospholipase RssA|nr:patatin-like phospholipase family protein [Solirubrobacterales bacterium]